jgi:hypothetical protein
MHPAAQVVNGDATCVVDCERMSGYDVTNLVNGDDVFDLKDDLLVKQQFHSVLETDVIFSRIRGIETGTGTGTCRARVARSGKKRQYSA